MLAELYQQFRSPWVRDLVWSLTSPDLLQVPAYPSLTDAPYFSALMQQSLGFFQELDQDDRPLQHHLSQFSNQRLGLYFERLWHFWLTHNPRFELLAHNVPLRNTERTIGELDVVVLDRETGEMEHWELAVKFYLQVTVAHHQTLYFGPSLKDRLDIKLSHLLKHQLPLGKSAEARAVLSEFQPPLCRQRLITKGRIFYPLESNPNPTQNSTQSPSQTLSHSAANDPAPCDPLQALGKDHLQGHWHSLSAFAELTNQRNITNTKFIILNKSDWLGQEPSPNNLHHETVSLLQQPNQYLPCQLLADSYGAKQRIFVVPDNFFAKACAIL